jgi:Asp/Glu/hydantoin racemase
LTGRIVNNNIYQTVIDVKAVSMPENSRLLIVNPNASSGITDALAAIAARRMPGLQIEKLTLDDAPSYIESPAQLARQLERIGRAIALRRGDFDLALVGCFSGWDRSGAGGDLPPACTLADTCLAMLGLRGRPFSIVTGGSCWREPIIELAQAMGFAHLVRSVRVSERNAQEVLAGGDAGLQAFRALLQATAREDGVDTILLGGAGFVGQTAAFSAGLPCQLLDCGEVCVAAIEALLKVAPKSPRMPAQDESSPAQDQGGPPEVVHDAPAQCP